MITDAIPANVHNDFLLDVMETPQDQLGMLALALGKKKFARVQQNSLQRLPTVYKGAEQNERRLDHVFKALVEAGKQRGARLFMVELKSLFRAEAMLQVLEYTFILLREYALPVTPIIFYTGKAYMPSGVIRFKDFLRRQKLSNAAVMQAGDLDFLCIVISLHDIDLATLLDLAPTIAPALFIVQRIYTLKHEDIAEFYRLCLSVTHDLRMKLLEKTGIYIVKYARGYSWGLLEKIEKMTLAEEDCVMGRVKFSREAAVAEALEQGIEQGIERVKFSREAAVAEGIERGKAEGIERGKAEGIEQGKLAAQRDIALSMLKQGIPEATVCNTTKLSRKGVQLLKKSL